MARSRSPLSRESARAARWDRGGRQAAAVSQKRTFSAGMKVRHASWGDGMVLNSRLEDGDETVDVFFEKVGLKRVAASLAGLTILEK